MSYSFELLILSVGLLAGVLSGMFGIGGGIVMVPILIAVCGLEMLDANAASLAAMLLPVGILGVLNYYKAGYIKVKESLWIAAGLFIGSFGGAEIAVSLNVEWLSKLYALFLLYIVVQFLDIPQLLFKKKKTLSHSPSSTLNPQLSTPPPPRPTFNFQLSTLNSLILLGLFAGVVAGLFGKGGGIIIVPALIKLFHYDARSASATSLAALQLPVGLPSVIVYAQDGHLNLLYASLLAAGIVAGAFFGSKWAMKLPAAVFKRIYAFFLIIAAGYMIWKYL
jgi:uncharacterized membrane protein YfcA